MNKLYYFVSLLIIGLFLLGCRPEELVKPTPIPVLKKVLTITSGETTSTGDVTYQTTAFEYNSGGKLSRIIENFVNFGNDHVDTTTFAYSGNVINVEIFSTPYTGLQKRKNLINKVITLNSQGFITKCLFVEPPSVQPYLTQTYEYNKNGYCIKKVENCSQYENVTNFVYSGSNLDSIYGSLGSKKYTYYTDKLNKISPVNTWFDYFGKECQNLLKTENKIITYTYEMDAENNVIKRLINYEYYGVFSYKYWDKYTYQK